MLPEDRLEEAAKQIRLVEDDAEETFGGGATARIARRKIDQLQQGFEKAREEEEGAEVVE